VSFIPPRCPNVRCPQHRNPQGRFYCRHGSYQPQCRDRPVPRFRCKSCKRRFSRQTFRHDYRDRRPECNAPLFELLTSGVGLRMSARILKLGVQSVQKKMEKLARTCGLLHENLAPRLPEGCTFVMDEEETYEGASIRPLTMPVVIEKQTWFVVASEVGSIRRLAARGTARRKRQDQEERSRGRRKDESLACVRKVLRRLAAKVRGSLVVRTDQKASYATALQAVFGDHVCHETTAGTLVRTTHNPLFPINTTLAMTRDNCGRLRRRSWLVTKVARRLRSQMQLFAVYRNYVRRRFNRDKRSETPARLLGLLPRQLSKHDVLRWRQDWGARSPHPLSFTAQRCFATPSTS